MNKYGIVGLVLVFIALGIVFADIWNLGGEIVIGHPSTYTWTDNHIVFNIDVKQLSEGSKPPSWVKCVDLPGNRIVAINSDYCQQIGGNWVSNQCWFTANTITKITGATDEDGVPLTIQLGDVCFEDKSETWTWANAPETIHLYFGIEPPVPQCNAASDCEAWCQANSCTKPLCEGYWECQSGNCAWICSQQPPGPGPEPCCDVPWYVIAAAAALVILLAALYWRSR